MKFLQLLISLFFACQISGVSAQNQVSGKVQDSGQRPVDFAEIQLTVLGASDPSVVYSDSSGMFSFQQVDRGTYKLRFLYLGQAVAEREIEVDGDIDLGVVVIDQQSQLSEIVLEAKKKVYESKVDRTVFHVENSIGASNGDALDAIKATPGLLVTKDEIKITGKNSVMVLIDDQLVQLSGEDLVNYLKTFSASDIQRIEVITTPPAKYEAQGNSGLLNIVMKPKRENAWNNAVRMNYAQATYAYFRFGDTFTYSKDRFSIQASADVTKGYDQSRETLKTEYQDEIWDSRDLSKEKTNWLSAHVNTSYKITPKSTLGLQYQLSQYQPEIQSNSSSDIYAAGQPPHSQINTYAVKSIQGNHQNFNLNFNSKLDSLGKNISANLAYFSSTKNQERPFETKQTYSNPLLDPAALRANTASDLQVEILSAKVDFELPYKKGKLSYGGKLNFIKNSSDSQYYNNDGPSPILDPTRSDQFQYTENTQAVYLSTVHQWNGKWSTQVGLRMEASQTQGTSKSMNQVDNRSFVDFFPTFYTQYQASEDQSFNINYSKRINRQGFWALNPFRMYLDAYSFVEGNPFLKPYNSHNIELTHTYKNQWTTKVSFEKQLNASSQIQKIDELNKLRIFTQENFYNMKTLSLSETFVFNKYNWWQSTNTLSFGYYHAQYKDDNLKIYELQNGGSLTFTTYNNFKVSNAFQVEFNTYAATKQKYLFYKSNAALNTEIGMSYKFLDGDLQLSAHVFDIFKRANSKTLLYAPTVISTFSNYNDNRYVRFGLKYQFGNKKIKAQSAETGNQEEMSRA